EDVCKRYEAYGWQILRVENGDTDLDAIDKAISEAKADSERPTLIWIHTTIGFGSPKAGSEKSHGSPLGVAEVAETKKTLGWDPEAHFLVPDQVRGHMDAREKGGAIHRDWDQRFGAYQREFPELAAEWKQVFAGELPERWDSNLPTWSAGEVVATRSAAGKVLNAIAKTVPWVIGGDADLGGSTKTVLADGGSFDGQSGSGRNIHFGVREHAMGSLLNGMLYHGGLRPFSATFFCFADYMRPPVRIAAMNGQPAIYVWTHDSIGLGEDGPTHQPVEHLMSLRAVPNLSVVRPADANEAREAWVYAMRRTDGPTALVLSRQNLPVLDLGDPSNLHRGGYVVGDFGGDPKAVLIATGSELSIAIDAANTLSSKGTPVRVVSMPCFEAFEAQDQDYRDAVLPPSITARVSVEAGVTLGWHKWIGSFGVALGVDGFGASAPGPTLMSEYGMTSEAIISAVGELLG
ncbi:MAG: transketolase, partial [Deltaproteobacteria bacterium]|nr:transketolase [Deltaproteobacteria bacterium]